MAHAQLAISRRTMVKAAAAFSICSLQGKASSLGNGPESVSPAFAYVGSYSGKAGNGQGISLFTMDRRTGALTAVKVAAEAASPTWITLSPQRTHLYSANGANGTVSSFRIERSSGDLTLLNSVSSEGAMPAYISIDPSGKWALVANYGAGSVAVLPIRPDGSLGSASDVHVDGGPVGPKKATNAPVGSFLHGGHDQPRSHCILAAPDEIAAGRDKRLVLQTDLGQDRIYIYHLDSSSGKLIPAGSDGFVSLPPGDGPRHLDFHPKSRWVYSIQEEASTIAFFDCEPESGALVPRQTISTLPKGFAGTNEASGLVISAEGRCLYASNRGHNSIACFAISDDGRLTLVSHCAAQGDFPRSISLDPTGGFLYAGNHKSDNITCYRVQRTTGGLIFTGDYVPVGSPACILFL